jgi:hypothetical protein
VINACSPEGEASKGDLLGFSGTIVCHVGDLGRSGASARPSSL